ncbi:MAG: response regulator [Proteobacteria bacterium]|nr:response regulator [Pseudomonadota bacterium]
MTSETRHAIVLVDDDKMILDTFQKRFEKKYTIFAFQSPAEFLKSLDKIKPFLFIVDWEMPEIDGLEVCRQIRKINSFDLVPVAFYTAKDPTKENVQAAYDAGAQLFIPKGLSKSFIELQINNLINSYKRSIHFLKTQKTMISVLKHNMASKLTGVTTAIEVLSMHPSFSEKELKEEVQSIIESSNQIRILFEDLNETLVLTDAANKRDMADHPVSDIIEQAVEYTKVDIRGRDIAIKIKGTPRVTCNKRSLSRVLYYLIKFIDINVPIKEPITIEIEDGQAVIFTIYVNGNYRNKIEQTISVIDDINNTSYMENLFYIQYSQNTLYMHDTLFSVVEESGRTGIRFQL